MIRLERIYEIVTDGPSERLVLRFSDEPSPDDMSEHCVRVEIEGPGETWSKVIYGMDEMQALLFAMLIAKAKLESSNAFAEGRLSLHGCEPRKDVGLPIERTATPESS